MGYIITGLDPAPLPRTFAQEVIVDAYPGFPCRVTLDDAQIGEKLLLVNYRHQPADSPFQASHAIYVREGATPAQYRDEIPPALARRMLSLRAFDDAGMMSDAVLVQGSEAAPEIERLLANEKNAYVQAHYAAPGCFGATITRG